MTVIVTGAQGFLGSRLCELWDKPDELCGVDVIPGSIPNSYSIDLCNFDALIKLVDAVRPRLIIHLAAISHVIRPDVYLKQSPHEILGKNVLATYNILQAVNYGNTPNCWVILAGSAAEYGSCNRDDAPPNEDDPCIPLEAYGISKHISTMLGRDMRFAETLRFANLYGPGQKDKFIPMLIGKALAGHQLLLHDKGLQVRQWLYVDDAVNAIKMAAARNLAHGLINIAPHEEVSIRDMTIMVYQELQDQALKLGLDLPIMDLKLQKDGGGSRRVCIDATKAYAELGWRPQVSLEEGIRRTVEAALTERMKSANSQIEYYTRRIGATS